MFISRFRKKRIRNDKIGVAAFADSRLPAVGNPPESQLQWGLQRDRAASERRLGPACGRRGIIRLWQCWAAPGIAWNTRPIPGAFVHDTNFIANQLFPYRIDNAAN